MPRPWSSSSFSSGGYGESLQHVQRVRMVRKVYWCSEPLNELGIFKWLSPRWLPRRLAWRSSRELEGPASWELGHSYALVDVELEDQSSERYRLNWGAGRRVGTNLVIEKRDGLPEVRIRGDRLEKAYVGTCTGEELYSFLLSWDGATYDANAANNRNCHHFVQELIHACTRHAGHEDMDRPGRKSCDSRGRRSLHGSSLCCWAWPGRALWCPAAAQRHGTSLSGLAVRCRSWPTCWRH